MSKNLPQTVLDAREFLVQLRSNNNRDWFQERKKDYEAKIKKPGNSLGEQIGAELTKLTGKEMSHKLFRINRDVRFSKDKTPYNTHLHLSWAGEGNAAFMFGISPDYVTAGAGVFGLQKAALDGYRAAVDKGGDGLSKDIAGLLSGGYRMDPPELKRVPAPYDKEHPYGELLKRKSLALWQDFQTDHITQEAVMKSFAALMPIYNFCNNFN